MTCNFQLTPSYNGDAAGVKASEAAPLMLGSSFGRPVHSWPVDLRESASILGYDFGALWADFYDLYGMGREDWGWITGGGKGDRRGGGQWPFYRTESELDWMRSASRWVAGWNSGHGAGLLGGVCAYVIHTGIGAKATPRDRTNDPADMALCHAVMDELEEYLYEPNDWHGLQQQLYAESHIDGDIGLWMFDLGDRLVLRKTFGEYISQPPGEPFDTWGFGVNTPPDDVENIHGYWITDAERRSGQFVPASDFLLIPHYRPGGWTRGIKRGMPFFSQVVKDLLDSAGKILRNAGDGTAVREAFAYIEEQAEGTARSDASGFVTSGADVSIQKPFNPSRTDNIAKVKPGYVPRVAPGYKYNPPPQHPGSAAVVEIVDALLRGASAGKNAPPWLISTSGRDQAAYSSDLVHEAPFVRRCEQEQKYYGGPFLRVERRAVEIGVRCGRLRPECLTRVKLTSAPPSIVVRDTQKEAATNQIYVGMGAKSIPQVQEELGLDGKKQRAETEEWNKWKTQAAAKAQPAGLPPGKPDDGKVPSLTPGTDDGDSDPFGEVAESQIALPDPVTVALLEAGFSGTVTDKLGRKLTYRDGKRVAGKHEKAATATARASAKSDKANSKASSALHKNAMQAHQKAAEAHERAGNGIAAGGHRFEAMKHAEAAGLPKPDFSVSKPTATTKAAKPSPPPSLASNFARLVTGAVKLTDAKLNAIGEKISNLPSEALEAIKTGIRDLLAKAAAIPGAVASAVKGAAQKAVDTVKTKVSDTAAAIKAFHAKVNAHVASAADILNRLAEAV